MWNQGQVTCEEYGDIVQVCRDEILKVKAQLELKGVMNVKDNKKCLCRGQTKDWEKCEPTAPPPLPTISLHYFRLDTVHRTSSVPLTIPTLLYFVK